MQEKSQRVIAFIGFNVGVQIATVEQKWGTFAVLDNGQTSSPHKTAQLPRAEAQVHCGIFQAKQAFLTIFRVN